MAKITEEKLVFGLAPDGLGDGIPLLLIGIPAGAWAYMADGKTHTLDLTQAGLPVRLVLYGARDHAEAKGVIEQHMAQRGIAYRDERRADFSIPERKP